MKIQTRDEDDKRNYFRHDNGFNGMYGKVINGIRSSSSDNMKDSKGEPNNMMRRI